MELAGGLLLAKQSCKLTTEKDGMANGMGKKCICNIIT